MSFWRSESRVGSTPASWSLRDQNCLILNDSSPGSTRSAGWQGSVSHIWCLTIAKTSLLLCSYRLGSRCESGRLEGKPQKHMRHIAFIRYRNCMCHAKANGCFQNASSCSLFSGKWSCEGSCHPRPFWACMRCPRSWCLESITSMVLPQERSANADKRNGNKNSLETQLKVSHSVHHKDFEELTTLFEDWRNPRFQQPCPHT